MDARTVRSFRASICETQSGLAKLLGVSVRAVEEWEAGRRAPPPMLGLAFSAINAGLDPWTVDIIPPRP